MAVNAFTLFGEITVDTRRMQQALRDANKALQNTRREMEALNSATNRTTTANNNAAGSLNRSGNAAGRAANDFEKLNKKIAGVGDKMQSFGTDMTYLVTAPILAAGAAALKTAIDFDRVQNQVNAAAGSFEAGAAKFQRLIDISRTSPGVFLKSAASAYALLKQMEGLTDLSIEKSIQAMGRIKLANPEFDATEFARNLNQLITQGFEAQDVKQAMGRLPSFGPMLAKKFQLSGSDYTTVAKEMRQLVLQGKITGDEFMNAFGDAVLNHPIYSKLDDTLGDKFLKIWQDIELALIPIGDRIGAILLPAFTGLAAKATQISTAFQALSPEFQNAIIGIAAFVASIGPVAGVVGTLIGVFAALLASIKFIAAFFGVTLTIAFLPFLKIIAIVVVAVAALAAIAYVAYKAYSTNFAGIADVVNDLWDQFKLLVSFIIDQFYGAVRPILDSITDLWSKHGDTVMWILKGIVKFIGLLMQVMLDMQMFLWAIVGVVIKIAGAIIAYIVDGFTSVIGFLKNFFNAFYALFTGDFQGAYDYVVAATQNLTEVFTYLWGLIPSLIIGALRALFPQFDAFFTDLANSVREWAQNAGLDMGTAIIDGMVSAIFGGSGRVKTALTATMAAGAQQGQMSLSEVPVYRSDEYVLMTDAPKRKPKRLGGMSEGGSRRGGSKEAAKETDYYQEQLRELREEYQKILDPSEKFAYQLELQTEKYKKLTPEQKTELQQLKERNISAKEAVNLTKYYNDTIANLTIDLAELNGASEIDVELMRLRLGEFAKLKPEEQAEIERLLRKKQAIKDATDAMEKMVQAQMTANASLLEFVNLNAPEQSNVQKFEQLLIRLKLEGTQVSDALVNAARAGAIAADTLAAKNKAYSDLSTLMQTLGMQTDNAKVKIQQLQGVLANTEALAEMARAIGTTVEDLRAKIEFEISEAQMPTFAGQWKKQLEKMRESTQNFAADVAGTLANGMSQIGSVFGQAVAEWDGTAKGFFRSLAQGFRQLIQQIIQELIRLMVMRAVTSILAAIGSSTGKTNTNSQGIKPGELGGGSTGETFNPYFATGGIVRGPGTGTSDSILARLSNGEFVIPASSVKKFGVNFFESLRKGQMPMMSYAGGGMAMPSASSVNTSNSTANYNNVFNISVPAGGGSTTTATMVQDNVLKALRKHEKRNK